jgi:amino acid permease
MDDPSSVPDFLKKTDAGHYFWGLVFAFGILFPMSIPRNASALRFSSLFGVLCSMYLCVAVVIVFFTDENVVASPTENFK